MIKFYFLLFFTFFSYFLNAQWTTNVVANTFASSSVVADGHVFTTASGKTWVAYYKNVPGPNFYEMRAQLVDVNGFRLLGNEGVLVNNVAHSTYTTTFSIAVDANENLIVAFASTGASQSLYINKISPAGNQLWATSGIIIPNSLNGKLTVLPNNDVIVGWLDYGDITRGYMQRLAASNGANVWAASVPIIPANASHKTVVGHMFPITNGFVHIFHDKLTANTVSSTLWAQRYDGLGVAQWAAPVQLSDKGTGYNRDYDIKLDGDTLFLTYAASTLNHIDAYIQRLNPNGTIPWGLNGTEFSLDNSLMETDTKSVIIKDSNTISTFANVTNNAQSMYGVYVQRYNKQTGARLLTNNGKVLYALAPNVGTYMVPFGISLFSDNNPLLMVGRYNSFSSQYIYGVKINPNGTSLWPGDTIPLGKYIAGKSRMELSNVYNNQAVTFWTENKSTFDQAFLQPIRVDGTTGIQLPVASFTQTPSTICSNGSVQFTSNSTGYIDNYSWSFPGGNPSTSTLQNPTVTYASPGTYGVSLVVSNPSGNNTNSQNNIINVNSLDVVLNNVVPANVCTSDPSFTINATPAGGTLSVNGVASSSLIYNPATASLGFNTLTYTVSQNGCTGSKSLMFNVQKCVYRQIDLNQPNSILLLGSPGNNSSLFINSEIIHDLSLRIYTSGGQLVRKQDLTNLNYGSVIPLNLTNLSSAIYHVVLSNTSTTGSLLRRDIKVLKH